MKLPENVKMMLSDLETILILYQSVLNMSITLLEKHESHTIQLFETVLGTLEKKIKDVQELNMELDAMSARKSR